MYRERFCHARSGSSVGDNCAAGALKAHPRPTGHSRSLNYAAPTLRYPHESREVFAVSTVSVIATVFNEAENIDELMESLLRQTRPPNEVVIVDGGSHDSTFAIMQRYCDKLPLR